MEHETDFAELYKRLIDAHFAPEPGRTEAALRRVLDRLSGEAAPEVPLENGGSL